MNSKEMVLEAVRKLPDDATLAQINEELAILTAIREGEADADAGRVTSHEDVKKEFASWISK